MPSLASEPPATTATRLEDARRHEAGRHHQGGDGRGAEVLHVGSRRLPETGRLGHRLGHVAAAALVAVADRLLAAAEDVLDRVGVDSPGVEEMHQGQAGGRLGGQVLQHHGGGEGFVVVVGRAHRRRRCRARPEGHGQGAGFRRHGVGVAAGAFDPVEVEPLGQGMTGQGGQRGIGGVGAEGQEVEVVHRRQQAEELGLGHDLARRAEAVGRGRRRRPAPVQGRGGSARGWIEPRYAWCGA